MRKDAWALKPHDVGSHTRYADGCRCDLCRAAHRKYTSERRRAALEAGSLSHGRPSTYDAGCRCEKCWNAKQVYRFKRGESTFARRRPSPWPGPSDTG